MSHLKVTKTSLNCGKISVLENWVKKKIIVGVIVFNIAIFFGVVQISKIQRANLLKHQILLILPQGHEMYRVVQLESLLLQRNCATRLSVEILQLKNILFQNDCNRQMTLKLIHLRSSQLLLLRRLYITCCQWSVVTMSVQHCSRDTKTFKDIFQREIKI